MAKIELIQNKYCLGVKSAVGDPNRKYEDRAFSGAIETQSGLSLVVGVVADGVGSADFGANAAQIAIDVSIESLKRSPKTDILEMIVDAFHMANKAVYEGNERSNGDGLTTLVLCVIHNGRCYVGNVGDSRAYWVQASKKMMQLTMDHTYYNLYGGDPNSDEAGTLINAIGKKASVEVDLALYLVAREDRKTAVKMGKAGLPLEPGDSILLCSDGLIKTSPDQKPYTKPEELIDAATTEFGDSAAVKMVGYAEGRKVDDNVSAVVIQYLDKDRIKQMEAAGQKRKLKTILTRVGIGAAFLALIAVLAIVLSRGPKIETVTYVITNTPQPSLTPTQPIDPGKARVDEVNEGQNAKVQLAEGSEQSLLLGAMVETGSRIRTQDSGVRIVVGEQSGQTGIVYVFKNSDVVLNFGQEIDVAVSVGSVFIQPGSDRAYVSLPQHGNARASVEGSKMIVSTEASNVTIWCFEGDCRLERGNGDSFKVPADQRRVYHSDLDSYDDGITMEYGEKWDWNIRCNFCLRDVVPTPTPTPTETPVPYTEDQGRRPSATSEPENGGGPSRASTPVPPASTVVPPTAVPPTAVPPTAVPPTAVTIEPTKKGPPGHNTPVPTIIPVETTPAPVETTPAPVETTPAPVETTPAPVETTPAPDPDPIDPPPPVPGN